MLSRPPARKHGQFRSKGADLLEGGFRRAELNFLVGERAISQELRSRTLGWRHSGSSVHYQVCVAVDDADGRSKRARYMPRAPRTPGRHSMPRQTRPAPAPRKRDSRRAGTKSLRLEQTRIGHNLLRPAGLDAAEIRMQWIEQVVDLRGDNGARDCKNRGSLLRGPFRSNCL